MALRLTRAQTLAGVAAQYKQIALGIANDISLAFSTIEQALLPLTGGGNLNGLVNGGAINVTATVNIVHTHNPIVFQMMDENGAWIVKSLQVDGASREAVAAMIATEIFAGES